ncbi:hypothetical protein [Thermoactinospora rubra]|uniref:hypothetical protein n=1 Tax=Thermoactinospora rubra TaxID=1088767 RepID=UPI00117C83C8|nr:hypothetical protein [Thermoactinospora rubra]
MTVRSGPVKIFIGLAVTALLSSGLAYAALTSVTGSECTAAEEDLIPVLKAQKILAVHPRGALARDDYSGCFQDDPFPYAGRFYEFPGARKDYIAFYEAAVKADGWRAAVLMPLGDARTLDA